MKDMLSQFARSGKVWLGLWSFVFLLLSVYSVLMQKPLGEGAVTLFLGVLGAYTANRTVADYKKKDDKKVDNPDEEEK